LFDGFEVEIVDDSLAVGGSWNRNGTAWDGELIRFFYERMKDLDEPSVLDVGASTGSFCLLAEFHPGALATAFEPNPAIFAVLDANIAANRLRHRVSVLQIAVGARRGTAALKVPKLESESGLACTGKPLRYKEWSEVEVEMFALDDLGFFPSVNLIKVDTEGAEMDVLLGGEKLIRTNLPGILMENNASNAAQFGRDPEECIELLRSWGYTEFLGVGKEDVWCTC
jgi:FkbM family methyltransferase